MPLTINADALTEIPEGLRPVAKEVGGKFTVSELKDGWALENVAALRKALSDERAARKDAETKVKVFAGIEDADAARDALEQVRAGSLKSSKDLEEFRASLQAKVKADLDKVAAEKAALEAQLAETLIDRDAATAIGKLRGKPFLLLPVLKQRVRMETNGDGRRHAVIIGEDGKPMVSQKAGSAAPMGVEEFVESLKANADYRAAFEFTGSGGSGAGHAAGGSARGGHDLTNLSPEARLALANERSTVLR